MPRWGRRPSSPLLLHPRFVVAFLFRDLPVVSFSLGLLYFHFAILGMRCNPRIVADVLAAGPNPSAPLAVMAWRWHLARAIPFRCTEWQPERFYPASICRRAAELSEK